MAGKRTARPAETSKDSKALSKSTSCKPLSKSVINDLKIMYTNADCLSNKKTDLSMLLQTLDYIPDLIIITEVNPKNMVKGLQESEFNMQGYNLFSLNIGKEKCRGIIVYVNMFLLAVEIDVMTTFSECLFIQIKGAYETILTVGAFYRSPSSTVDNNLNLINLIGNINKLFTGCLILLGDFNFSTINWCNWTTSLGIKSSDNQFLVCLRKNFLSQHVLFPTRVRGTNTPHTLDLIISNGDFISNVTNLSPLGKSDHSVLLFECKMYAETESRMAKFRYDRGDFDGLRCHVQTNFDNSDILKHSDIDEDWISLRNIIEKAVTTYIPATSAVSWKKKSSWKNPMPSSIRKLIRKKHRLWTRFQETRDKTIEFQYKHNEESGS